jgi:hypothetical protein
VGDVWVGINLLYLLFRLNLVLGGAQVFDLVFFFRAAVE